MQLLATLKSGDVDPEAPISDYSDFKERTAGRAIVFDENKVALLHVGERGYYMLPGGGAKQEDIPAALAREVMEEIGCKVVIEKEVGMIAVYFDRWKQKQTDYCYIARKVDIVQPNTMTAFEKAEGFTVAWATDLSDAISLVRSSVPENLDGKLVRARDLLFLETVWSAA